MSDLVTIATAQWPWEAHILRGRLEAEGIFAAVIHENFIRAYFASLPAVGGARVQVIDDDVEAALKILRDCEEHHSTDPESSKVELWRRLCWLLILFLGMI